MDAFCTIITSDYLPFAETLSASLQRHASGSDLMVLIVDDNKVTPSASSKIQLIDKAELIKSPVFRRMMLNADQSDPDRIRWALKPLLISWLLDSGFKKIIYADPDIYFVNDYRFLFQMLDSCSLALTPHWADPDIYNNPDSVFSILKGGLYNAGFIAANDEAREALGFWSSLCQNKMDRDPLMGIHDDQKYLDLLPVQFEAVHIIRHQGCNLASWNIQACKRELVDGKLLINRKYEPVFIHFAKDTVENILNRNDELLRPYLDQYAGELRSHGFDLLNNLDKLKIYDSLFYKIKHRTRVRTRLKRFFFRLAEKL